MKIPETKMPPKETDIGRLEFEIEQLENRCEDLSFKNRKLNSKVVELERDMVKLEGKIIKKARRSIMPICGFNFGILLALALIDLGLIYMVALTIFALVLKLISDITNVDNPLLDGMTLGYLTATVITSMGYLIAFLIG